MSELVSISAHTTPMGGVVVSPPQKCAGIGRYREVHMRSLTFTRFCR